MYCIVYIVYLRRVPGDELVAVLLGGEGADGAVLGVEHLEAEAAFVRVGEVPGHVEDGARLQLGPLVTCGGRRVIREVRAVSLRVATVVLFWTITGVN